MTPDPNALTQKNDILNTLTFNTRQLLSSRVSHLTKKFWSRSVSKKQKDWFFGTMLWFSEKTQYVLNSKDYSSNERIQNPEHSKLYDDFSNLYTLKYEQSKFKTRYTMKIDYLWRLVAIIWGCWGMTNGISSYFLKNYVAF